ncbi:MAG: branched-chain amino acid ABC transporter permease [Desulfomonilaceae bacterium]|nr:branched-chain amino acid ABC transporter permease [Desulfomonilaceae bacterium]
MSHKARSLAFLIALLCGLSVLPLILSTYYLGLVTGALILAILAMSANLLLGYLGLASVGQAAFFGVASYAVAIYTRSAEGAAWSAIAVGLLAAVAAGLVFGPLAIRTRDIFFLVIMLAFCQILYGVTYSWRSVTGGDDGLPGLARPDLIPGVSLDGPVSYYVFVAVVFLLVVGAFRLFVNSPFGLVLKGIRDSDSRMRALGYNVWLYKYIAFTASALIGGISGVLHAYYYGCPNPADFSLIHSSSALLMVILGGPGALLGPLAGSLIIVFVREFVSNVTDRWLIVLGFAYVCTVLFFPDGLIGTIGRWWREKSSRGRSHATAPLPERSQEESSTEFVSAGKSN